MSRDEKNTKIMFCGSCQTVGLSLPPGEERRGEAAESLAFSLDAGAAD